MDLFESLREQRRPRPLADRVRPDSLEGLVGQEHLLGPLRQLLAAGLLPSMLLWGPPGVGKTTLARVLAQQCGARFVELSAVAVGVAALREAAQQAEDELAGRGRRTVLFIDEIHRFNKGQQDAVLPFVESGSLTLIGATTENPSFRVNPALRSRCQLFELRPLQAEAIRARLQQIASRCYAEISFAPEALEALAGRAGGDLRKALGGLEVSAGLAVDGVVSRAQILQLLPAAASSYDRKSGHYDCASAFQKSLRGSDVDAALYYLGKMLLADEDPHFICRRLTVCAAEDVGMADPHALVQALAAWQAIERLGMPEGRIPLAQAVVYVARAPKSDVAYRALDAVLETLRSGGDHPVPDFLRASPPSDAYQNSHRHPGLVQHFLPEPVRGQRWYPAPDAAPSEAELERVRACLQARGEGPLSSRELGQELGLPPQVVVRCVRAWVQRGRLSLTQTAHFSWLEQGTPPGDQTGGPR